jgi:hypothetical protein
MGPFVLDSPESSAVFTRANIIIYYENNIKL